MEQRRTAEEIIDELLITDAEFRALWLEELERLTKEAASQEEAPPQWK